MTKAWRIASVFALLAAPTASNAPHAPHARAPGRSITYNFDYSPAHDNAVARMIVDVTYDAPAGRTVFDVPMRWADQSDLYEAIDSVTLVTPGKLDTDSMPNGWIAATTTQAGALHLRYEIHQDWDGPVGRAHYFRAIIQPAFFLLLGHNALVLPRARTRLRATMNWRVPAGSNVATSWGQGVAQHAEGSADDLRNAVYAGGALHETHTTAGNAEFTMLYLDAKWPFQPDSMLHRAAGIVNAERAFWKEQTKTSYLITLLPSVNDEGGTRYLHAMALFVDPKYQLAQYTPLIAHESFHEWLGGRMPQPAGDREMLTKWFAEGFTDYYGDRIAYEAGLMSADDYAGRVNDVMRGYYLSPARDATSETISKEYWTNPAVNRISYERGRLFALRLNNGIMNATHGAKNLDDLLRVVMKLVPDSAEMSDSVIARAGQRIAGDEVRNEIEEYIDNGRIIDLPPDVLGACFAMDSATIAVFDLGFDFDAARASKSKQVTGVEPNGPAYAAGMRDGAVLKGMSFFNGDVTKDATFTVTDGSGEKKISYRPVRSDSAHVPSFHPRACK